MDSLTDRVLKVCLSPVTFPEPAPTFRGCSKKSCSLFKGDEGPDPVKDRARRCLEEAEQKLIKGDQERALGLVREALASGV